jgi:hypothetical protein
MWQDFETEPAGQTTKENAFDVMDSSPTGVRSDLVQVIPDGPRCGDSKQALELKADGYNDWGTSFALAFASFSAIDETGTDGIAFWAKATGPTIGFTLTLSDKQSFAAGGECMDQPDAGSNAVDPASLPTWVPFPERCSPFQIIMSVTPTWTLYKIPFTSFNQPLNASDRHTPLDPSQLYLMTFIILRGAHLDLWLDDIGFYKTQ